jgi:hypothetical protein
MLAFAPRAMSAPRLKLSTHSDVAIEKHHVGGEPCKDALVFRVR